jgi:hypothetical protein
VLTIKGTTAVTQPRLSMETVPWGDLLIEGTEYHVDEFGYSGPIVVTGAVPLPHSIT